MKQKFREIAVVKVTNRLKTMENSRLEIRELIIGMAADFFNITANNIGTDAYVFDSKKEVADFVRKVCSDNSSFVKEVEPINLYWKGEGEYFKILEAEHLGYFD